MDLAIVIPSRMGSTRFPGKPLCDLLGKPMIQWVCEAAARSGVGGRVVVATPDLEIVEACAQFGAEAVLTSHDHATGTDRIAEVARTIKADVFLNVQGDEPLVDPSDMEKCVHPVLSGEALMASVMTVCPDHEEDNHAVVKVVTDLDGNALYFSRNAIPFPRHDRVSPLMKHVGMYAYTSATVSAFAGWSQSPLEIAEGLEQLRFLEHGVRIKMARGHGCALAVDTPEQAAAVRLLLAEAGPG